MGLFGCQLVGDLGVGSAHGSKLDGSLYGPDLRFIPYEPLAPATESPWYVPPSASNLFHVLRCHTDTLSDLFPLHLRDSSENREDHAAYGRIGVQGFGDTDKSN